MELENILEQSLKMKEEYENQLEVLENENESLMSQINKLRSENDSAKNKMAQLQINIKADHEKHLDTLTQLWQSERNSQILRVKIEQLNKEILVRDNLLSKAALDSQSEALKQSLDYPTNDPQVGVLEQ